MDERDISYSAIEKLQKIGTVSDCAAGKILLEGGESAHHQNTYLILSGSVLIYVMYGYPKTGCILDYLHQWDLFGEMPLFVENHYRTATVKANEPCKLLRIACDDMRHILKHDNEVLFFLTKQMAIRLHQTTQRLYSMCFFNAEERLMHYLFLSAKKLNPNLTDSNPENPESIMMRITRKEIGFAIGCARETAGKLLYKLEKQRWIKLFGLQILLLDPIRMIKENFETDVARVWIDHM